MFDEDENYCDDKGHCIKRYPGLNSYDIMNKKCFSHEIQNFTIKQSFNMVYH